MSEGTLRALVAANLFAGSREGKEPVDRIERHLAECAACAAVHTSMERTVAFTDRVREAPLPASLLGWNDLKAQLQASGSVPEPRRRVLLSAFAFASVLAIAFVGLWSANRPQGAQHVRLEAGAPSTPPAVEARVELTRGRGGTRKRQNAQDPQSAHPTGLGQAGGAPEGRSAVAAGGVRIPAGSTRQRSMPVPGGEERPAKTTRRGGSDDLAYLNPDPETSIAPWTHRTAGALALLEMVMAKEARGGDRFITVPMPPIAGASQAAVKAAVEAHARETAVVDARLVREVTLRHKGASFADLCESLTKETGIQFTANRRVADDKVTVLCHPRSLRNIMRMIAQHFGFAWVRKGEEGAYEYELTQTLRSQLLEEGLRDKDQEEMLLAIDQSMERFRKYRGLSLEQVGAIKRTGDNYGDLFQLQMGGLAAINHFFSLSRGDVDALRAGQTLTLDLMGGGSSVLPPSVTQGLWHSFDESYDRERKSAQERGSQSFVPDHPTKLTSSLTLDRSKPGEFALKGNLSDQQTGLQPSLAVAKSPASAVQNVRTNAKITADPDLQKMLNLKPSATCRLEATPYPDTESLYEGAGDKVTTADVLEQLFDAAGIDVLGDYFSHLQAPASVTVRGVPLFTGLCQIGDAMRMRWTKTGAKREAWLQFRTSTYYYDRPQEIPGRLLDRWKALRKKHGVMRPEELAEAGQLPDAQLDSVWMSQAAIAIYGLDEWQMARIPQLRPHWRLLGQLSDAQRRDVWTEKGLPYGDLPADLQNRFLSLAYNGDVDRPSRHQVGKGSLRGLYAFSTHPVQYGGSFSVLQSNPLLFVYTTTTAEEPERMAIVGPWNAMYGMRPEMMKPDAYSIMPGR